MTVLGPRLKIHEIYLSIQGESSFAGLPCLFIRTTGCPLRCVWCDTEHAFSEGNEMTVEALLERVRGEPAHAIVEVTGGEPLVQKNVLPLLEGLCDAGRTALLETSGAFDIGAVDPRVHVIMDIKCPDSGEVARNLWENVEKLQAKDEVKLVLASRRDYEFAREVIRERELALRCAVLLSAVSGHVEPADVVAWLLEDQLPVRFQLQLHKQIWEPRARGV